MKQIIVAVLLLISLPARFGGQQQTSTPPTVLHHVTVINPGSPPMSDMAILITGSRIAAVERAGAITIPAGAQVIDGHGKFVIPGLMDMHHHLQSGSFRPQQNLQANLGRLLAVGVTTVFDPSSGTQEFVRLKAAAAPDSSAYARFFGTGPMFKVYAHAPLLKPAKETLVAGVDGMHGILDEPVDAEFLSLMKKNGAVYVPTLSLFEDIADVAGFARRQAVNWDRAKLQPPAIYQSFIDAAGVRQFEAFLNNTGYTKERLKVARENVKRVFDAGVPVVLGTDTGFFGVFFGVATQIELELLVEAGLTPADALRAATINAARMIGKERELGAIEAGKFADLVVLDADPLDDVRNVARIHKVIKGGVQYEPIDPATPK